MRVLITGSSGQIGTNLGIALVSSGHDVIGIDVRPNSWTTAFPTVRADLTTDAQPGDGVIGGAKVGTVDAIVHLAAHAKVHALVERPRGAFENHAMVTNALEFARMNSVPIILASSREVYGNLGRRENPVSEAEADFRSSPSPYAAMKLASEALASSYFRCYGLPYSIIRFSNVYGRYDDDLSRLERAIWVFNDMIKSGRPVTVFGAEKTLDFTYIDDAVDGLVRCLTRLVDGDPEVRASTFNLAHGTGHSLIGVVNLIAMTRNLQPDIRVESSRPGEVTWYVADITRARDALGYQPQTPVTTGIPRAITEAMSRGS
ncbi:MAG: NAD-dependent epimerase/dehydratase family protein [Proteobacteria bacterium]|nr:NAD-dependent epimerase/dehydratase family protein [Pseudomonadota bacterium]NBQ63154.1 NAD-dependent epimerase/dehydratase family protein [Pseudomonadota bacterium]NDB72363.1 NAD-dependent epimerase/dehydratase family protein [Pseudomonadota bacterium]NDF09071.1 NAD-dependent epimerase/dehydratase family protein [Pseudomonadota bacterium]NDF38224.1 NAD-dependent epimerase/dehydratase family protein [Pseudomonadota bacterium]